jgi:hypothetical protein
MLGIILVLLLIACEVNSPGYISEARIGTILRFAARSRSSRRGRRW